MSAGAAGHDCSDVVQRLYEFLDGELDATDMVHVRQHLEACLPCLEAFDFEEEVRRLVARRCQEAAPDHLRKRIFFAIQAEYRFVDGGDEGGMSPP